MNITFRVVLDNIGYNVGTEVANLGNLALRWRKMIEVDGVVKATEPHRCEIGPLDDVDATLDMIYAHLASMGYEATDKADDIALIKWNVARYMTSEVIAAAMDVALARKLAEANG